MNLRTSIAVAVLAVASLHAQPKRPAIIGIAHVSFKTNDMSEARKFYGSGLGFAEAFGVGQSTYFKVNERQFIEIMPGIQDDAVDRFSHLAVETASVRQLREYLLSKGVQAPPIDKNAEGDDSLRVHDPEGRDIEFVQYAKGSLTTRTAGKSLPESRISQRIIHAGFIVQDQAAEDKFWKDILGFRDMWHGGMTDTRTDWVSIRVPDGTDWLEYMLNQPHPSARTRGIMNHLALGVPSTEKAWQMLTDRGMKIGEKPKIGRDGKWQLNLYDGALTRAELMEPEPVQTPCCSPILK
jgi:catechol 2,3-dioxygenase-like lactoylglutathione lyase family enzyme